MQLMKQTWMKTVPWVLLLWMLQSLDRMSAQPSPNVVLVYIDDLGYGELAAYGGRDIPTPHLDRLAKQGVCFSASYIPNPPCCPSRCSLMMGQYAQRFGKYGMSRGMPVPSARPTLAQVMQTRGYVTGQIGKWDIGSANQGPAEMGFQEVARVAPKKRYTSQEMAQMPPALAKKFSSLKGGSKYFCVDGAGETRWLTDYDGDQMVDFIERHHTKPFFLYWSPEAVHSPSIEVPESLMARTQAKGRRRSLAGAIVSVDDQIGKLLTTLDQYGLRENTLVIFSSDNGANGGEGGSSAPYAGGKGSGTQKEGWVRVPTIFSMPGTLPEDAWYHGMIANFDFYATAAALSGASIPSHCDGVDLLPYLNGKRAKDPHQALFWLNNEPGDAVRRHMMAVRWKDWRLYRKYDKDPWQLFDLKSDPREAIDRAASNPQIVADLSARHAQWAATLEPQAPIPGKGESGGQRPKGHGWETVSLR